MTRDEWFAMIKKEHINLRFASEVASTFKEYPSSAILEVMWNSDWGRKLAKHFGIETLRTPPEFLQWLERLQALEE